MQNKTTRFEQVPIKVAEKALRIQAKRPISLTGGCNPARRRVGARRLLSRGYLQLIRRRIN